MFSSELKNHYDKLFQNSKSKIIENNFVTDDLINHKSDNRYGITLVIIPSHEVKEKVQFFLDKLKEVDPNQYYYRNTDIHITVMSIISCYPEFSERKLDIDKYYNVIEKSVSEVAKFTIDFKGITASSSAVMVQGFPSNNNLNLIRENLRVNFKKTNLEQSLDKRYSIQTAHSTVVRFSQKVKKLEKFLEVLENFREFNFGTFEIKEMIFVANDWYQKKEKVKKLKLFSLE